MENRQHCDTAPPLLEINLTGIIRSRAGWKGRLLPRFLLGALERLICQRRLNEILREVWPAQGSDFARRIMEVQRISLSTQGLDRLPREESFIFACNHPLGGLDGICMVKVLGELFGDDNIRVMVNDMLMNVAPLAGVFLPVNKYGAQGRRSARLLGEALQSGKQIVMFPAGLVSRLHDDGGIRDLEWQKSVIAKAIESGRRIVPVFFDGLNTSRFYRTALIRKKIGLKINIEQALLPSELCRAEGASYRIFFGSPLSAAELPGSSAKEKAAALRDRCYSLRPGDSGTQTHS